MAATPQDLYNAGFSGNVMFADGSEHNFSIQQWQCKLDDSNDVDLIDMVGSYQLLDFLPAQLRDDLVILDPPGKPGYEVYTPTLLFRSLTFGEICDFIAKELDRAASGKPGQYGTIYEPLPCGHQIKLNIDFNLITGEYPDFTKIEEDLRWKKSSMANGTTPARQRR